MSKELVAISPEGVEVANAYLTMGNIEGVCSIMSVTKQTVADILGSTAVKKYIDTVYLDTGYRNRNNIASLLDEMIASKLVEAEESGIYSSKDLADLLNMAHRHRMDEIKMSIEADKASTTVKNQTNVQINDSGAFGTGNYGKLMERLVSSQ